MSVDVWDDPEGHDAYGRLRMTPVERPSSLTDLAYVRLRELLLLGEFAPGEALSIVKLAEALNMSRSPVRAAAERIIVEGLLERSGSNLVVRVMSLPDLLDALEVRISLEALATRLATPRMDAPTLE
jgi:DNA-binding GntR family transcriptional regulator